MRRSHEGIVIRPPSEAHSFLLPATIGCSHNKCTFCVTYKFSPFSVRPFEKVREDIELAARWNPGIRRVFLCDGNAMCLSYGKLARILDCLVEHLPDLERVGIYSNAGDILTKTPDELSSLHDKKLGMAYLGLESGNDAILERVHKGATGEDMVQAVKKAQQAGIDASVIVLLGLGSRTLTREHAADSGRVASRMDPRYLSALTLMLLPGTPLFNDYRKGEFELMDPVSVLEELRLLVESLEVEDCVFRTNHASNYLPIAGHLPEDKDAILETIDYGLANPEVLKPESRRAL